jgi:single-strand DNA-binding protein
MAGSVNKVILVGNLGADPDIRTTQQGSKIANLSVATSESWKDRNTGEKKENTQWHRIVIFSEPLAGLCEQYLKKGSKVYVEGQLETRKWTDQNGQDKYTTEVVLRPFKGELTFLDSRSDSGGGYQGNANQNYGQQNQNQNYGGGQPQQQAAAQGGAAPMDDFEDEIPF